MRTMWVRRFVHVFVPAAFVAAGQLQVPFIGYLTDSSGELRAVTGVGGNLLLSDPVAKSVRAAAFAGPFGLMHVGDRLLLVGPGLELIASMPGVSSEALVAVSPALPLAVAWLQASGEICALRPEQGGGSDCFPVSLEGTVQAIGVTSEASAMLAVERNRALWLALVDLEKRHTVRQMRLVGVAPPVALLGEEILYCREGELVVRRADGAEIRTPSPVEAPEFDLVGRGWVSLRDSAGARWILRVSGERLEVFRLPGGAP